MIDSILGIVNKFIPDQNRAQELKAELEQEYTKRMSMQHQIIMSENNNGSGKWRVRLMYLCMVMVGTHLILYEVVPYFVTVFNLGVWTPQAPIDEHLWGFLKIGVGGYIGGRTAEKAIGLIKK